MLGSVILDESVNCYYLNNTSGFWTKPADAVIDRTTTDGALPKGGNAEAAAVSGPSPLPCCAECRRGRDGWQPWRSAIHAGPKNDGVLKERLVTAVTSAEAEAWHAARAVETEASMRLSRNRRSGLASHQ
jgi:hypothetical protein